MEIQSLSSNLPATTATQRSPGSELGKNEFFELLVTQMRNQDPLAPKDNSEFIAQLAQFSSLESLQGLQSQMTTLNVLTSSLNNAQALGLMGRSVTFQSSTLDVKDGASPGISAELPSGATGSVKILDSSGKLVRTLDVPAGSGRRNIDWDGKDADGKTVADGTYSLEVTSTDAEGNQTNGTAYLRGQVDQVSFADGMVYLQVAGQSLALDQVVEVAASTNSNASAKAMALRAFSNH